MKHRNYLPKSLLLVLIVAIGWLMVEWKKKEHSLMGSRCAYQLESLYVTPGGEVTEPMVRLLGWTGIRVLNDPVKGEHNWPEARITLKTRKLEEAVPAVQG